MGEIEILDLLNYVVPVLIAYSAWLHRQVIKMQLDIAVNSAKDEDMKKQFDEIKSDIKELKKDLHDFIVNQNSKK